MTTINDEFRDRVRTEFLKRIKGPEFNAWELVADDPTCLWVYEDGSYAQQDKAAYWDGSGIEPIYFATIQRESLQSWCEYEGEWSDFVEASCGAVEDLIIDMFLAANEEN